MRGLRTRAEMAAEWCTPGPAAGREQRVRGGREAVVSLGLDVGQSRTKLVGLRRDPRGWSLVMAENVETPVGTHSGGRLLQPELAGRMIGRLRGSAGIRVRDVGISLLFTDAQATREVIRRKPREAVLRHIASNSALRGDAPGVAVLASDFVETAAAGLQSDQLAGVSVVGRREAIRAAQTLASESGLVARLVTAPAIALANAWRAFQPQRRQAREWTALVHGGFGGVGVVAMDVDEVPVDGHYAEVGVQDLVRRVREHLIGSDPLAVEEGLFSGAAESIPSSAMDAWLTELAKEIRRTMAAATRTLGGYDVYLSGGFARVPGICEALSRKLNVPVAVFDPLPRLQVGPELRPESVFGPELVLALGLALQVLPAEGGEGEPDLIRADLRLPVANRLSYLLPEFVRAVKGEPMLVAAALLAVLTIGAAATLHLRLSAREAARSQELRTVGAVADSLSDLLARRDTLEGERARLRSRLEAVGRLDPDRFAFVRLMNVVAQQVPANVWDTELSLGAFNAETGGIEFTLWGFSPSVDLVGRYERSLSATGEVRDVRMVESNGLLIGEIPVIRFQLSGRAGGDGIGTAEYAPPGEGSARASEEAS